ncbi:MAG: hypothetical protein ACLGXA_18265, partial [Acidobacteriota bacterium]
IPIYVPEHEREVVRLLIAGKVPELAALLEHRVALGSRWASGLLGYLEAAGILSGEPNLTAAISRSTAAARAGDAYAQFVLGWALWEMGDRAQGMRWMKRSGIDGKFLPAWASVGVMLYQMAGKNQSTRRTALRALWSAHRRGHIAPLGVLCSAASRGHFGPAWRVLGVIAYPFVVLRTSLMAWWNPISERSFFWYPSEMHCLAPALKSNRRVVASVSHNKNVPASAPQQFVSRETPRGAESSVAACPEGSQMLEGSDTK